MDTLDLTRDPIALTAALVDIPSPSHQEKHLAGHLDTVPIADNVPHRLVDGIMYGCGTVDMKSGLAVYLHLFATLANSPDLTSDLTVIAYECEEVDSEFNGLGHLAGSDPGWLAGDLALLGEPSGAIVEAGCQGTLRVRVTTRGRRAHSARGWLGDNAAHRLGPVIERIAGWEPREVDIDGCVYREGLNIVKLESYLATNIIPDEAHALVNYRFAPDLTVEEAFARVEKHLAGYEVTLEDGVAGALPGLEQPAAAALVAAAGEVRAKYGWTDVARFAELGIPAVNFGPGDPAFAHRKEEQVPVRHITQVADTLRGVLTNPAGESGTR